MQFGGSAGLWQETFSLSAAEMEKSACGRKVSVKGGSVSAISPVNKGPSRAELIMHAIVQFSECDMIQV